MTDGQFLGLTLTGLVLVFVLLTLVFLFFGTICLHWAARILKFKKPRLKTAFLTNLITLFVPSFVWGGALFAQGSEPRIENYEFLVGTLASMLSFLLCVTAVRTIYGVGFGKALAAYLLSNVIAAVIVLTIALLIFAVIAALGWSGALPFRPG